VSMSNIVGLSETCKLSQVASSRAEEGTDVIFFHYMERCYRASIIFCSVYEWHMLGIQDRHIYNSCAGNPVLQCG
jgi:hypothetical protein